jgi:hypothetical protein
VGEEEWKEVGVGVSGEEGEEEEEGMSGRVIIPHHPGLASHTLSYGRGSGTLQYSSLTVV